MRGFDVRYVFPLFACAAFLVCVRTAPGSLLVLSDTEARAVAGGTPKCDSAFVLGACSDFYNDCRDKDEGECVGSCNMCSDPIKANTICNSNVAGAIPCYKCTQVTTLGGCGNWIDGSTTGCIYADGSCSCDGEETSQACNQAQDNCNPNCQR